MKPLAIGDPAPDFRLPDLHGGCVSLADLTRGGFSALLIFLRHLG